MAGREPNKAAYTATTGEGQVWEEISYLLFISTRAGAHYLWVKMASNMLFNWVLLLYNKIFLQLASTLIFLFSFFFIFVKIVCKCNDIFIYWILSSFISFKAYNNQSINRPINHIISAKRKTQIIIQVVFFVLEECCINIQT